MPIQHLHVPEQRARGDFGDRSGKGRTARRIGLFHIRPVCESAQRPPRERFHGLRINVKSDSEPVPKCAGRGVAVQPRMCLFLCLIACAAPSPVGVGPFATESIDGLYRLILRPEPDPPVMGEASLLIEVESTETGASVGGATVTVSGTMPAMGHGFHGEPDVVEIGDGLYRSTFTYPMSGEWELSIELNGEWGEDNVEVAYDVG